MRYTVYTVQACFGLLLLSVLAISVFGLAGGRINRTASHPVGFYMRIDAEPRVGLYAEFCAPKLRAELPPLDETYVPPCTVDQAGAPLLKRIIEVNAEEGAYTVQGDDPLSLDSRVFGPLSKADILHVLVPVWTFSNLYHKQAGLL
jgi:type IV secretory pathway protease TraF